MDKPEKRTYRKGIVFLIIAVVIFLMWAYLNSPYTPVEERKIINYALQGSRDDFKLNLVYINKEKKIIKYEVVKKYKGKITQIFLIRSRMNEFLDKNSSYFLNDGYKIDLDWVGNRSGGPGILQFSNMYKTYYLGESNIFKSDFLDWLILQDELYLFSLSDISDYTLLEDIKGLILREYAEIEDIEILENFKSLEFFEPNDKITDEEIERVKEKHPNGEIYGR